MKKFLMVAAMMTTMVAHAQWRVGVTGGAGYNVFSMDRQYQTDFRTHGRWGVTMGISGQYDFNSWFGVRADLNWSQKNHEESRDLIKVLNYKYRNDYMQLPIMASFSFGGKNLRGFCNLGVYGSYWLNSHISGSEYNFIINKAEHFSEDVDFNSDRDQRWDCGFMGGIGLEYRFAPHWAAQAEARYYYSTTSTTKQYMRVKDYRYNSTTALQIGVFYLF